MQVSCDYVSGYANCKCIWSTCFGQLAIYQLQFLNMILANIDIEVKFPPASSTTPSPTSATRLIKPIPVVRPLAELSISFEQRQLPDHSTPGLPSQANWHVDYDDDYDENDEDDDEEEDDEDGDDNDDCYDEDDVHLHCVSNVSVCSFEDKILARNIIILILVAEYIYANL